MTQAKSIGKARFREATAEDASKIVFGLASLAQDLGYAGHFNGTTESVLQHGFGDQPQFHVAIVEWGQKFGGLVIYFPYYSTMRGLPGLYVQDLWVSQAFRQHGLGQGLLHHAGQAAKASWGAAFMMLAAHSNNLSAQRFYRRIGFNDQAEDNNMVLETKGFAVLVKDTNDA